jgi:hypothetical protein
MHKGRPRSHYKNVPECTRCSGDTFDTQRTPVQAARGVGDGSLRALQWRLGAAENCRRSTKGGGKRGAG